MVSSKTKKSHTSDIIWSKASSVTGVSKSSTHAKLPASGSSVLLRFAYDCSICCVVGAVLCVCVRVGMTHTSFFACEYVNPTE